MSHLNYNGYLAEIDFDKDDGLLVGKVLFIDSLIMFHAEKASDIEREFHKAVDAYLAHCKKHNVEPNRSFSGTFNIRTQPEIHKAAAEAAAMRGQNLNQFCSEAIETAVKEATSGVYLRKILGEAYIRNNPGIPYQLSETASSQVNVSPPMISNVPPGFVSSTIN